jgi:hypothetical protein
MFAVNAIVIRPTAPESQAHSRQNQRECFASAL